VSLAFGEFDGRFLGISLTVDSRERRDNLQRYAFGPGIPGGLGPETPEREFIESLSCLTVVQHEARHFHDFLISAFGSHVMRTRLVLALNLSQILVNMLRLELLTDADFLPVPVTTWCLMPPAEQADFLAGLAAGGLGSRAVELPRVNPDWTTVSSGRQDISAATLGDLIAVCGHYQDKLRQLSLRPAGVKDIGLYPVHVWEASALLVQAEEVNAATGSATAERFLALMDRPGNRYGAALRWIRRAWPHGGVLHAGVAAVIVAWCLFGDYTTSGDLASPVARLAMLWDLFRREPRERVLPDGGAAALFSAWDRLTSQPPTLDGLRRSLEEDAAFVRSIRAQVAEVPDELYDELAGTFDAYREYVAARRFMVESFLAAPEAYLLPVRYLNALASWTAPPLKVEARNRSAMFDADSMDGWYIQAAWRSTDGKEIPAIAGPPWRLPGAGHIQQESAFRLYTMFAASDVVLGPDPADLSDVDRQLARTLFGNEIELQRVLR
jgi:hypothetical protein